MNRQNKRLVLLFSLVLVIIPMVIFPGRLGLPLMNGSAVFMLFEVAFYGFVLFLFRREANLLTLTMGAALLLIYRMALGAVFGVAIIIMYGLGSGVAFSLGMAKYVPAVLLHVLATPFVLRPVFLEMEERIGSERKPARPTTPGTTGNAPRTTQPVSSSPRVPDPASVGPNRKKRADDPQPHMAKIEGQNQFEKAVSYLGESAAVHMAMLMDEEGLPLARFSRCDEDDELWAPLAIILEGSNRQVLNRYKKGGDPEKIDITTRQGKIHMRRIEHIVLVVLAEREADETVLIRIAQAVDMVRKYMSERYSPALFARVEERYVSNT